MDGSPLDAKHFIPFRRHDILSMCLADGRLTGGDAEGYRRCAEVLTCLVHYEFHRTLENLKDAYAPVAADSDTLAVPTAAGAGADPDSAPDPERLVQALGAVLKQANFELVSRKELQSALAEESMFRVRLDVSYQDFEEVLVFKRGERMRTERIPTWFGLRHRSVTFLNYDRVLIYVRFKHEEHFRRRGRHKLAFKPGSVFIKLFQNIPKADIEMLFPNAGVRMKAVDKLVIGVPALVGGVVVIVTKLGATAVLIFALVAFWLGLRHDEVRLDQTALLGLGAGLFAAGGFLWRQFSAFRNRKIRFLKVLADNLYFKKLDTNVGVFHRMIDAAEEEECKEVLVAYYFLLTSEHPLDGSGLDRRINAWFQEKWACRLDFDVEDALRKIEHFGLARRDGTAYRAVPLDEARLRLDGIWAAQFDAKVLSTPAAPAVQAPPPAPVPAS